ncbi:hypothetical protein M422DRAFT_275590 [Sphaerobolus stellatus SS14]|uniref:Uncharacterized protein n=1 Tax=Sphaerobolus stellatus (strain SS14) TaxID=990650 RepID=A0A0C9T4F3_SPHS4|nr:hypothetical protein M422DRAFT_275590 [Sphaerobolus stellatus SS14]
MLGKRPGSPGEPSRPSKCQATSSQEEGESDDDPSLALPPPPPPQAQPLAQKFTARRYPAPAMTKVQT